MRFLVLITSLCVAIVVSLACLFTLNAEIESLRPAREFLVDQVEAVAGWVHEVRYGKDIEYYGMKELNPTNLEYLVPLEKSVSWWTFNTAAIRAKLLSHPLVREAKVERCGNFSWGCFKLSIDERKPVFLAGLKNQLWILGDDGSFVSPYRRSVVQRARLRVDPAKLPTVDGLEVGGDSPQLIQGRARYVAETIRRLEHGTPYTVRRIKLRKNGEVLVEFDRVPYAVVFGASHDQPNRLDLELERFVSLSQFLRGHLDSIVSMDLAFSKLAVVRFKDEELVPDLQAELAAQNS